MPRASRVSIDGQVWHITHRCHERSFLLKFVRDRKRWRHWLFEARRRYNLSVLNYIATSNHIHLLCADQGSQEISRSMQLVAGRVAQEYNVRKRRKGAFWEDRYHATAVQADHHLVRCFTYIDLNMVRAGVVKHPRDWDVSGYQEIQRPWQRKGVIDFRILVSLFGVDSQRELSELQNRLIAEEAGRTKRDPAWTKAVAVGDDNYLDTIRENMGARGFHKRIIGGDGLHMLREQVARYLAF